MIYSDFTRFKHGLFFCEGNCTGAKELQVPRWEVAGVPVYLFWLNYIAIICSYKLPA